MIPRHFSLYVRLIALLPTVVAQPVTVELSAEGRAWIVAEQVDGGSSDACGITSLSVEPNAFDCGSVGEVTVTLTATDVHGNRASAEATVTVRDATPPAVATKDITVDLNASGHASIAAAGRRATASTALR